MKPQGIWYSQRGARTFTVSAVLIALIVIVLVISVNSGHTSLSPMQVLRTFMGMGSRTESLILFEFRLPRIVISLLVGAGLAVAGAVLQGVSRNPLADPGILGINSGAGLAVILYVSLNPLRTDASPFTLPVLAILGSFGAAAAIYWLAYRRHKGLSTARLLLAGIAMAAGIQSLMLVLVIRLDERNYNFVANWLAGSIWGTNWDFVLALLPWIVILIPFVISKSRQMDVLMLGDQTAAGLGSVLNRERLLLVAAAVALSGACVSVSGGISFLGLIGPHLARSLVGPRHKHFVPVSALVGALIMLAGDSIARTIIQPSGIPTGIVVAVIGAPYFLYLLSRSRG
ncbi:iron ABC transporter permease [Paenibacillus sp. P96]|uniref:Iron ABC transporter permease n=1 Tax=Paenibacillus zeirhizosphaerae TaxID=2987519 RepID=A0ABT9FN36_9BACL|nr:iron ABC transporter permease [Paenibacillus sp. P96]MDP4096141.1 iron ABC transporter permease [Paenibacillus sp. P96]